MARHFRIPTHSQIWALLIAIALGCASIGAVKVNSNIRRNAREAAASGRSTTAAFSAAAAENARLSKEVNWQFGGKAQHGWYIYVPLIDREIGADAAADSAAFAKAVAEWQRTNSIPSSGILDEPTWMAMVGDFQNSRLKNKHYAEPDELITVPVQEFYDPTRPEELREVERETYAAYRRMIASAAAEKSLGLSTNGSGRLSEDEKYLKIISAFRSREYQGHLRAQSPNSGRAGLAINSPHFTGRALDLYVGGEPVSTKDENRAVQTATPVYRWLVKNAGKFGFRPYFYEPWHWEYVR